MRFNHKVGRRFLCTLLLGASLCFGQSLKVMPAPIVPGALPARVQIFCATHYNPEKCAEHAGTLSNQLRRYPVLQLKQWSFAIVPSDEWKELVASRNGNPNTPAFTVLENRTTVFESVLFEPEASRAAELFNEFGKLGPDLLELAITHELGHALCNEPKEYRADENGRLLRAHKPVRCVAGDKRPPGRGEQN